MARYELTLPAMGEGIIEATIMRWHIGQGDRVSVDQPLLEVATDKIDSEIPSPVAGSVAKLVYHEGEIPRVGQVIAVIDTGNDPSAAENENSSDRKPETVPEAYIQPDLFPEPEVVPLEVNGKDTLGEVNFVSPFVRFLAAQRGISAGELKQVMGTGLGGRVTKDDIRNYILNRKPWEDLTERDTSVNESRPAKEELKPEEGDELVEMDRMRKIIASRMLRSKKTSPHVTSFLEADVTRLSEWREHNKSRFFSQEQVKLTFTPLFVEAVARALKDFPRINVSLSGEQIIVHKNINVGVATALPDGNLIVPVIRNADRENLGGLARRITDLAERARNNSLQLPDISGGTFTVTNIGQYNNLTGTPIINQPESAILAIGTIIRKPWAVKTPEGYGLAVREITMLSLTYDHRIIDGALGGSFLSKVAWYLENFNTGREM